LVVVFFCPQFSHRGTRNLRAPTGRETITLVVVFLFVFGGFLLFLFFLAIFDEINAVRLSAKITAAIEGGDAVVDPANNLPSTLLIYFAQGTSV
jgi:hypothetical protein